MSQVRQSKSDNSLRKEDHEDPDIAQKGLLIYFFPDWSIKIISVTGKLNLSQGFSSDVRIKKRQVLSGR
jgi:hypothetical protein